MNIQATTRIASSPEVQMNNNKNLKKACQQFEALMLGMVLKDTLTSSLDGDEKSAGTDLMREFATEQMATSLSQNGGIGIADMIIQAVNNRGQI